MAQRNLFLFAAVFSFLAIAHLAQAATLKGTTFGSNLEPVKAIVSVNTTTPQTMVAQNGSFYFEVPKGNYLLSAHWGNSTASEAVSIVSEGVFNIDLIIFGFDEPSLEVPSVLPAKTGLENTDTGVAETPKQAFPDTGMILTGGLIFLAIAAMLFYKWQKGNAPKSSPLEELLREELPSKATPKPAQEEVKTEEGGLNELQKTILGELRKSEGRMTQKELRKLLPFSEAKVSIELDLLEEKRLIKKFKKGRGNVVILNE